MNSMQKCTRRNDGFIVVAVLWILAALATLASVYAVYVSNTAFSSRVNDDRIQAQGLVSAAGGRSGGGERDLDVSHRRYQLRAARRPVCARRGAVAGHGNSPTVHRARAALRDRVQRASEPQRARCRAARTCRAAGNDAGGPQ